LSGKQKWRKQVGDDFESASVLPYQTDAAQTQLAEIYLYRYLGENKSLS
jgi:hypothetical protein